MQKYVTRAMTEYGTLTMRASKEPNGFSVEGYLHGDQYIGTVEIRTHNLDQLWPLAEELFINQLGR